MGFRHVSVDNTNYNTNKESRKNKNQWKWLNVQNTTLIEKENETIQLWFQYIIKQNKKKNKLLTDIIFCVSHISNLLAKPWTIT